MLRLLRIRNLALIRELEIEFSRGLNILTGETGSGKSIVVDALGLVLGACSSQDLIRAECDSAVVEGLFEKFAGKRFFFVSLGVVGYFCLLCLNVFVIKSDFVLIGVFREIFTLPLLLLQFVLLVLSIMHCIKDKYRIKTFSFWSFLILLASNAFCIGSFIF